MKKAKLVAGLAVLVIILSAGCFFFNEYTRKPADLTSVDAMAKTTAMKLVSMFESNEQKANELYLGKPIDISGSISEINNRNDTLVSVLLGKSDDMHRVSCLLDAKHSDDLKKYKVGDSVTIRGICTGYLIDVELNRCVVLPDF